MINSQVHQLSESLRTMNFPDMLPSTSISTPVPCSSIASPAGSFVKRYQKFVKVPYQWERILCESKGFAYYITPSGHVLLKREHVLGYLESRYTCKCYLNLQMKYEEVFDFTCEVGSHQVTDRTENAETARCELWTQTIPENYLRGQKLLALGYLTTQEVEDLEEVYQILNKCSVVDQSSLFRWMGEFEWDKIRVTRDGRMFTQNLTSEHLSHLTYELSNTMELNNAQAAITSAASPSTLTEATTNCDTTAVSQINNTPDMSPVIMPTLSPDGVPKVHPTAAVQHSFYPKHVNIGSMVTSSIPASLANFNNASAGPITLSKRNYRRKAATSKASKAKNSSSPAMIVSNAPITVNPLLSLPAAQLANFNASNATSGGGGTLDPHHSNTIAALYNSGSGSTRNLLMDKSQLSFLTNSNSYLSMNPSTTTPYNLHKEQLRKLIMLPNGQMQELPLSPPSQPPPPPVATKPKRRNAKSTEPKPPQKSRAPRKPRGKKVNQSTETDGLSSAQAAEMLRKQNELAAGREIVSVVLDKPMLTKQEDSAHLRAPTNVSFVSPLPRVENFVDNSDSLALDSLPSFKYLHIVKPETTTKPAATATALAPEPSATLEQQPGTSQGNEPNNVQQQTPPPPAHSFSDGQRSVRYSIDDLLATTQQQAPSRTFQPYEMVLDPVEAMKLDHAESLLSLADTIPFSNSNGNSTDESRSLIQNCDSSAVALPEAQQSIGSANQNGGLVESFSQEVHVIGGEFSIEQQQQQEEQMLSEPPPLIPPPPLVNEDIEIAKGHITVQTDDQQQSMQIVGPTEQAIEADGASEMEVPANNTATESLLLNGDVIGGGSNASSEAIDDSMLNGELYQIVQQEDETSETGQFIGTENEDVIVITDDSNLSVEIDDTNAYQLGEQPLNEGNNVGENISENMEDMEQEDAEAQMFASETPNLPVEEPNTTVDTTIAEPSSLLLSPNFEPNESGDDYDEPPSHSRQKSASNEDSSEQSAVRQMENNRQNLEVPPETVSIEQSENDSVPPEENETEETMEGEAVMSNEQINEEVAVNPSEPVIVHKEKERNTRKRRKADKSSIAPSTPRRSLRTRLSSSNLYANYDSPIDLSTRGRDEQLSQPTTSTSTSTSTSVESDQSESTSPESSSPPTDEVMEEEGRVVASENVSRQEDSSDSVELIESPQEYNINNMIDEDVPAVLNEYEQREDDDVIPVAIVLSRDIYLDDDGNGIIFQEQDNREAEDEGSDDARVVPVHEDHNTDEDIIFDGNASPVIEVVDPSMQMDEEDDVVFAETNHNLSTRHIDLDQSPSSPMCLDDLSSNSSNASTNADQTSSPFEQQQQQQPPSPDATSSMNQENDTSFDESSSHSSSFAETSTTSSRSQPNTSRNDATPRRGRQTSSNTSNDKDMRYLKQREMHYKRMQRLKKELEFQGRPVKENSDSDEKDRLSPPLPPQERVFNVSDIVWGQRGDVRYWPGKLVPVRSGRADRTIQNGAKAMVRWFGKGAEKESMIAVDTLLTLTEGLEEHHRARKRLRSGSHKRLNRDLEEAIQEAMGWNQPTSQINQASTNNLPKPTP